MSNHTYSAILTRLLDENYLFPPPGFTSAGIQKWEADMATAAGGPILLDDQCHVHIVAIVDLVARTGDIRDVMPAVTPVKLPTTDATSGYPRLEQAWLVQRDVEGAELDRDAVELRMDACTSPGGTGDGLVQQTLALAGATATIELLIGDTVVDSFSAGASLAKGMKATMWAAETAAGQPHRRLIDLEGIEPEEGVGYTVQARPVGEAGWSTPSVRRPTPAFSLDRNQFGLTPVVDVRVLCNQGFSQRLVAAEQIALDWDVPKQYGE